MGDVGTGKVRACTLACLLRFCFRGADCLRVAQVTGLPAPAGQLTKVLAGLRHTFVVADATLPDCPLVYASDG